MPYKVDFKKLRENRRRTRDSGYRVGGSSLWLVKSPVLGI